MVHFQGEEKGAQNNLFIIYTKNYNFLHLDPSNRAEVFMEFDQEIERLIDTALAEDLSGSGDITTMALIPESTFSSGKLVLKEKAVVAGLPYLSMIFQKVDPKIELELRVEEGDYVKAGTVVAKISGPVRGLLSAERTVLNFIQHVSGVATAIAAYVYKVRGLNCEILDTRKTLPGLRALEQYGVRVGGGVNHRHGLNHRFIIKRNHLAFFAFDSNQPILDAVKAVRTYLPDVPVEVEVCDFKELAQALQTECDSIMLDNMSPDEAVKGLKMCRKTEKKVYLESKTMTLETVRRFAETGVDGIATSASYFSSPTDIRLRLMI
ncbi:MAG: Nicotinate-nucleotide pyrophosphorylase [carboxylating] [Chlamydiae bacterium]|nr:Nicotinate-nucleotide pyrophosphorylase [carboxylating] [Chlamydiota bacterium]